MENRPNWLVTLTAGLVLLAGFCSLGTAAMGAASNAANSIAMATMAATLQTSQCVIAILALAVIVTPVAILLTIWRMTAANQIQQQYRQPSIRQLPPPVRHRRLPDPEADQVAAILRDWSRSDEPINRR